MNRLKDHYPDGSFNDKNAPWNEEDFFEENSVVETMHNTALKPGDIVKFNTTCVWNKCSGIISELLYNQVNVTLPGGKRLAFGYYEVQFYCKST